MSRLICKGKVRIRKSLDAVNDRCGSRTSNGRVVAFIWCHSGTGITRQPLKLEIRGSSPRGITNCHPRQSCWQQVYVKFIAGPISCRYSRCFLSRISSSFLKLYFGTSFTTRDLYWHKQFLFNRLVILITARQHRIVAKSGQGTGLQNLDPQFESGLCVH